MKVKDFLLHVLERIIANIVYSIGVIIVVAIIDILMRYNKQYLWFTPVIIGILLIALLLIIKLIIERKKAKLIEIQRPKTGWRVNFRDIVNGTISPPNSSVQVLVYAGDNFWYRQKDVIVTDNYWEVECQFGNENSSLPSQYKIVAISPAQHIPERIPKLPSGVLQSEIYVVVRS